MRLHPNPIADAASIRELADELQRHKLIAWDTEFIRETTFFPKLELLQIATLEDAWLVDVRAFHKKGRNHDLDGLQPLLNVLSNPQILKVVHAAQGDQECLFTSFGMVASPSFDTAVGAGLAGFGDGIGLANLLRAALGVTIKKGHARTNWSIRPLPSQLSNYALADVQYLAKLGQFLLEELEKKSRKEWALEVSGESESTRLYAARPDEISERLARNGKVDRAGYPVLVRLIRWREARIRDLDVPRKWLADDGVLVDLARVRPKGVSHLNAFRGLNKGEIKKSGEKILELIEEGLRDKAMKAPARDRSSTPNSDENRSMALLRCFVGLLADANDISSKHLVAPAKLVELLRVEAREPADLVAAGVLSEGASRLIGQEMIDFLHGKRSLRLREAKVEVSGP